MLLEQRRRKFRGEMAVMSTQRVANFPIIPNVTELQMEPKSIKIRVYRRITGSPHSQELKMQHIRSLGVLTSCLWKSFHSSQVFVQQRGPTSKKKGFLFRRYVGGAGPFHYSAPKHKHSLNASCVTAVEKVLFREHCRADNHPCAFTPLPPRTPALLRRRSHLNQWHRSGMWLLIRSRRNRNRPVLL